MDVGGARERPNGKVSGCTSHKADASAFQTPTAKRNQLVGGIPTRRRGPSGVGGPLELKAVRGEVNKGSGVAMEGEEEASVVELDLLLEAICEFFAHLREAKQLVGCGKPHSASSASASTPNPSSSSSSSGTSSKGSMGGRSTCGWKQHRNVSFHYRISFRRHAMQSEI